MGRGFWKWLKGWFVTDPDDEIIGDDSYDTGGYDHTEIMGNTSLSRRSNLDARSCGTLLNYMVPGKNDE